MNSFKAIMEECCYHLCCSEPAQHYSFLCLQTVHAVYVCSECRDGMKDLCELVYELCTTVSRFGVPHPFTPWSNASLYHVEGYSALRLLMKYLLEIMETLEVKISTRWPSYSYIEETLSVLGDNLRCIEHIRRLECS